MLQTLYYVYRIKSFFPDSFAPWISKRFAPQNCLLAEARPRFAVVDPRYGRRPIRVFDGPSMPAANSGYLYSQGQLGELKFGLE